VIREAFMASLQDPALLEEAEKMRLPITPLNGEEVSRLVAEMYASPKPVVDRVRRIFSANKN
jgi:hypothetical protein